jgi:plasmid stabilization system protein ParE
MEVIVAPKARGDIASILAWTEEYIGRLTLKRYAKLIATAIEPIAENPDRAGSTQWPEIAASWRNYHLYFSRKSAGLAGDRIRRPRHLLLYGVTGANALEIGRVRHESMDFQESLPEEHRRSPQ